MKASGGKTDAHDSGGSGATGGLGGRKGETSGGDGGDGSGGRVSGCSADPSACENDTDECSPNPCENGADCVEDVDGFTCEFPAGFEGELCKSNIDECEDSPCKNGGPCTDDVASYSCDCTGTGYEGDTCDAALVQQLTVPPGASSCKVVGVSDGGTVIAANCQMGVDTFGDPYFWEAGAGWTAAQRASGYSGGYLVGLSADGSTAVGSFGDANSYRDAGVWTSRTTPASILPSSIGGGTPASAISASGNAVIATDSGGEMLRWMPLMATGPDNWGIASGSQGVAISGNRKVLVAGTSDGYQIWTSTIESQKFSSAGDAYPRFASHDGSTFVYLSDGKDAHVVRNGQTTYHSDCSPAGLSSDGRRMLAECAGVLRLFRDGTGVDVQTLIEFSGASYTLRPLSTESSYSVPVRLSWDGHYIALGVSSKVVLIHLQE